MLGELSDEQILTVAHAPVLTDDEVFRITEASLARGGARVVFSALSVLPGGLQPTLVAVLEDGDSPLIVVDVPSLAVTREASPQVAVDQLVREIRRLPIGKLLSRRRKHLVGGFLEHRMHQARDLWLQQVLQSSAAD